MAFFESLQRGLKKTRESFKEQVNFLLDRGPELNDDFWDDLLEVLILLCFRMTLDIRIQLLL